MFEAFGELKLYGNEYVHILALACKAILYYDPIAITDSCLFFMSCD